MFKLVTLTTLILVSQALFQSNLQQGSLFSPETQSLVQRSPLGRAILHLAELQSRSKSLDYSLLFGAIDELSNGLQARKVEESQLFESDLLQYYADNQHFENQITQYSNEVALITIEVEDLLKSRVSLEQQLTVKSDELIKTTSTHNQHKRVMEQNENIYQSQLRGYDQAVAVIETANQLLSQVQESASFLQHDQNSDNVKSIGEQLEKAFVQLQTTRRIFYQPIVTHLIQMAQNGFADQQLLTKVLTQLDQIRVSLIANKDTLTRQYQSDLTINKQIMAEYASKMNHISNTQIPQITSDIDTRNGFKRSNIIMQVRQQLRRQYQVMLNIIFRIHRIVQLQQKRDGYRGLLIVLYIKRQNSHNELTAEYDHELQVVDEVNSALERGGVRRQ